MSVTHILLRALLVVLHRVLEVVKQIMELAAMVLAWGLLVAGAGVAAAFAVAWGTGDPQKGLNAGLAVSAMVIAVMALGFGKEKLDEWRAERREERKPRREENRPTPETRVEPRL